MLRCGALIATFPASALCHVEGPVDNGVMAVLRFENGVLAQLHDAFNVPFAGTGIEIHGSAGSLFGSNVMTQRGMGEVCLRDAEGERSIPIAHRNLYSHALAQFNRAVSGDGAPVATGDDGLRSLACALAVVQATQTGSTTRVTLA
jgi:1,5-anhydro-D-fructose reductase (1,5-anhydro-D-mannitol-forming)